MRKSFILTALVLFPVAAAAQVPCTPNARQVVNAAYMQVLERPANRLVTDPLVAQLMQGQSSVREIVRELAMSPDHRQRFLSANTLSARNDAIAALYRHLLGRAPDEEGLRAHAEALVNGDPTQVIDTLIDSPEYQQSFGNDTVPGGRARYCGADASTRTELNPMRFGTLDRNRNGSIELNEWSGSRAAFAARDWNADGVLSGDEVRSGGRRAPRDVDAMEFEPPDGGAPAAWTPDQFRQIDRNRDNRITANEWYYSQEFFTRADRNRDSVLSLQEFTGSNAAWDDDRDMRFSDLDINANGRVERGEWQGSLEAFRWLDRNNDNVLSRAEVVGEGTEQFNGFTSLDANANGTLSISEWRWSRASFTRYDTNQDGVLSRQEFTAGGGTPASIR